MDVFLMSVYILEALAFLTGMLSWQKVKESIFKYFIFYLLYIFIADIIGYLININKPIGYNELYYNYAVIPVEFNFFFWLFYKTLQPKKKKVLPIVCSGIYLTSIIIDALYFSKHHFLFNSVSYSIGNLLLLVIILIFFMQLVNSKEILSYKNNMVFWICVGLLIYYLGSLPYYGLTNTFVSKYQGIYILYNKIEHVLDCIMYLMFALSFIWGKPKSQSSQSSSA